MTVRAAAALVLLLALGACSASPEPAAPVKERTCSVLDVDVPCPPGY